MKEAIKSFAVGAAAAVILTITLSHIMAVWLRPYDTDSSIPNAVTTGEWDHPPVEGGVL